MSLPPIPERKKFPDPEIHRTKINLHAEIRDTLMALYRLSKGGRAETIMKFIGLINPGKNPDPDRLPYLSRNGKAKQKKKMECVFAIVSDMVLDYWGFCMNGLAEDRISVGAGLEEIQKITKIMDNPLGLQVFKIKGDLAEGFELVGPE